MQSAAPLAFLELLLIGSGFDVVGRAVLIRQSVG